MLYFNENLDGNEKIFTIEALSLDSGWRTIEEDIFFFKGKNIGIEDGRIFVALARCGEEKTYIQATSEFEVLGKVNMSVTAGSHLIIRSGNPEYDMPIVFAISFSSFYDSHYWLTIFAEHRLLVNPLLEEYVKLYFIEQCNIADEIYDIKALCEGEKEELTIWEGKYLSYDPSESFAYRQKRRMYEKAIESIDMLYHNFTR